MYHIVYFIKYHVQSAPKNKEIPYEQEIFPRAGDFFVILNKEC